MKVARFELLLFALLLLTPPYLLAADEQTKEEATPAAESKEAEEPEKDRYAVPEGDDVPKLLAFIKELQQFRPKDAAEYRKHRSEGMAAIAEAAERVMKLEGDKTSEAYITAGLALLQKDLSSGRPEDPEATYQKAKELLAAQQKHGLEKSHASLALGVARALEYGEKPELAAHAYSEFAKLLAKSEDEELAKLAARFEGSARRLSLPGNEMKIEGQTMDGKEFDWASYRGKVVLVDFWATWCGPCIAEMPNVRKNYDLYHDRGFDVVSISLDSDRDALEAYLEKHKHPWANLHDETGKHPIAEYYGISAIPTVVFVDREGKVASLRARGPELGRLLEEMIGPPEQPAKETVAETSEEKDE